MLTNNLVKIIARFVAGLLFIYISYLLFSAASTAFVIFQHQYFFSTEYNLH
jgi:hypothetical protein